MGGKGRQAKHLAPILSGYAANSTAYYEPFVGGGSIFERVAGHAPISIASDAHLDLMFMWQALLDGWQPPTILTKDEYEQLRNGPPSALRGFAGFGLSFGGKWFGGYAANARGRDYCGPARRVVLRKASAMRDAKARVRWMDYRQLDPMPRSIIYCDPPYANTTRYVGMPAFDSANFWSLAADWAESGCAVFVSEYTVPSNSSFACVWHNDALQTLSRKTNTERRTERLYALAGTQFIEWLITTGRAGAP